MEERRASAEFFVRFCECLNGFDVHYMGVGSDLLTNKRAAGRPKDLADVAALEQRSPPAD